MYGTGKIKYLVLCLTFAVCAGGCGKSKDAGTFENIEASAPLESGGEDEKEMSKEELLEEIPKEASGENNELIYVDVCGQVNAPGVYALSKDSRVFEAIEKAGGMTGEAAASAVNQAAELTDGQQIYVPSEKEIRSGAVKEEKGPGQEQAKINLNTATKEELMTLNGIGEAKAEAIIKYREEHGNFSSVEDIMKIEGIKDGIFNKVKEQITV